MLKKLSRQKRPRQARTEHCEVIRSESFEQIVERMRSGPPRSKPKRGNPGIADKEAVLNAAAKLKAKTGNYTRVAADFHLTARQVIDMVWHNKTDFDRRVKRFRADSKGLH
jgi:hypothetical protein